MRVVGCCYAWQSWSWHLGALGLYRVMTDAKVAELDVVGTV